MKRVLITGITGQDGLFLTKILLQNNCKVYGITRETNSKKFFSNLRRLMVEDFDNISLLNSNLLSYEEVSDLINSLRPDYIFNLSGPSSVYKSYKYPELTIKQITTIFKNLTQSCINLNFFPSFFQASSSEMFEKNEDSGLNEYSNFGPKSPYAKAKLINHQKVIDVNKKYNWNIKSGIMFNHESEFRDKDYLFMKVIESAKEIKSGSKNKLEIGSLDWQRDWTFAGDVANAINLIALSGNDSVYVIGSGSPKRIQDLVEIVFGYFDLDWQEYILLNDSLLRSEDPKVVYSNPKKLKNELGWMPKLSFEDLVIRCIEFQTDK